MFIVLNKSDKKIVHINNAPIYQNLSGKDVYFDYNEETMMIVLYNKSTLPKYWKLDKNNNIVEKTLEEQVNDGDIKLEENYVLKDGQIVFNPPRVFANEKETKYAILKESYIRICNETDNELFKYNKRQLLSSIYPEDEIDKNKALERYKNATIKYKDLKESISNCKTLKQLDKIDITLE
jgi:hypothetical protein